MLGIQDLLEHANIGDPAQIDAYTMYKWASENGSPADRRNNREQYDKKIRQQAIERRPK